MKKWQIENSETSEISEISEILFRVFDVAQKPKSKFRFKNPGKKFPRFSRFPRFPSFRPDPIINNNNIIIESLFNVGNIYIHT